MRVVVLDLLDVNIHIELMKLLYVCLQYLVERKCRHTKETKKLFQIRHPSNVLRNSNRILSHFLLFPCVEK